MEAVYAFGCELPPSVIEKMRETFRECEPYLDSEVSGQDSEQIKKTEAHKTIESMPPEQLSKLLEFASKLTDGKKSGLSGQKKQRTSSTTAGSSLEPYQTEKLSSKNRVRTISKSGPKGACLYIRSGPLLNFLELQTVTRASATQQGPIDSIVINYSASLLGYLFSLLLGR